METMIKYDSKQLLSVVNVNGIYTINKETEKAILIEMDNGRWIDDGKFKPLWIPKSLIEYIRFNDSRDNSQYGIHVVKLPDWFINQNSKNW